MSDKNKLVIEAKNIEYCSALDEEVFFFWLNKIEEVSWRAIHDTILISIGSEEISDHSFRELLALFYRYEIQSNQLVKLVNKTNKSWVLNENSFWFESLTSKSSSS